MLNKTTDHKGTLYIVSAPSGGGKTSLVSALLKAIPNLEVSISYTTRPKRPGENHEVNYYFVAENDFEDLIKRQAFLEYAKVFGHYYGTSKFWVEEKLRAGIDVILEIDWQGGQQIRQILPESVGIFILPPSWQVLEARLRERKQDDDAVISRRLSEAHTEISHCCEYDYLVINDDFMKVLADLKAIIQARRLRTEVQKIKYAEFLNNLLL